MKDLRCKKERKCSVFDVLFFALALGAVLMGSGKSGLAGEPYKEENRSGSKEAELKIRSDELIIKNLDAKAHFKGNVVVNHRDMVLEADQMKLYLKKAAVGTPTRFSLIGSNRDHEVDRIEARGNVKFKGGIHRAQSERAEYLKDRGILIMTGNPEVWEGDSHVKGSKITILIDEEKSIVEQSRMILQPQ